jgi:hypothetical protein
MSLVEWCEARTSRYDYALLVSEFTNSISNSAFFVAASYSPDQYPASNLAIKMVGLGSFIFHATESHIGQLMDEIPMSLLAYLYFVNLFALAKYNHAARANAAYACFMTAVWHVYVQYKLYLVFVSFFVFQLCIPFYILCYRIQKTQRQMRSLRAGSRYLVLSVGCWLYERHLYSMNRCPTELYDPRYYLHSFWHIGMACAHYHFMNCISQQTIV